MTQAIQKTLRDSAGMRWTALLLLALAMFCAYIFMDILSPIKDLMQETRGWDSTAFGTMQGSEDSSTYSCSSSSLRVSSSTRWAFVSQLYFQQQSCSSEPALNGTL